MASTNRDTEILKRPVPATSIGGRKPKAARPIEGGGFVGYIHEMAGNVSRR